LLVVDIVFIDDIAIVRLYPVPYWPLLAMALYHCVSMPVWLQYFNSATGVLFRGTCCIYRILLLVPHRSRADDDGYRTGDRRGSIAGGPLRLRLTHIYHSRLTVERRLTVRRWWRVTVPFRLGVGMVTVTGGVDIVAFTSTYPV